MHKTLQLLILQANLVIKSQVGKDTKIVGDFNTSLLSSGYPNCNHPAAMDKLGLPERGDGNEKKTGAGRGRRRRMKPRQGSDQGSKFNIQHCIYIGQAHRPHPLFQLDYISKQGQQADYSKFLVETCSCNQGR